MTVQTLQKGAMNVYIAFVLQDYFEIAALRQTLPGDYN